MNGRALPPLRFMFATARVKGNDVQIPRVR